MKDHIPQLRKRCFLAPAAKALALDVGGKDLIPDFALLCGKTTYMHSLVFLLSGIWGIVVSVTTLPVC